MEENVAYMDTDDEDMIDDESFPPLVKTHSKRYLIKYRNGFNYSIRKT